MDIKIKSWLLDIIQSIEEINLTFFSAAETVRFHALSH